MIEIRPKTLATGPNNPDKQISVTVWNAGHRLTGTPDSLVGTDGTGVGTEYPLAQFVGVGDLDQYVTETELTSILANYSLVGHTHEISDVNGLQEALDALGGGGGGGVWGTITGTLSDQTDLQAALNLKANLAGRNDFTGVHDFNDTFQINGWDGVNLLGRNGSQYAVINFMADEDAEPTAFLTAAGTGDDALHYHAATHKFWDETESDQYAEMTGSMILLKVANANKVSINSIGMAVDGAVTVNDQPYGVAWDNNVTVPTKNAIYDKIESVVASIPAAGSYVLKAGDTMTGDLLVPDEVYGPAWDGSPEVPTKNAVYDKVQSLIAGGISVTDGDKGDVLVSIAGTHWVVQSAEGDFTATGIVTSTGGPGTGSSNIRPGDSINSGYANFFMPDTTRAGYVGLSSPTVMSMVAEGGRTMVVQAAAHGWRDASAVTLLTLNGTALTSIVPVIVPTEAYGPGWDSDYSVPTKHALYDKIEAIAGTGSIYVLRAGDTMTGSLTVGSNEIGLSGLSLGNASFPATINFNHSTGLGSIIGPTDSYHAIKYNCDEHFFANTASSIEFARINAAGVTVPDEAYGTAWNGKLSVPTKNAVYDKVELLSADIAGKANTSALANYLPLTGGTLSGNLYISMSNPALVLQGDAGSYYPNIQLVSALGTSTIWGYAGFWFQTPVGGGYRLDVGTETSVVTINSTGLIVGSGKNVFTTDEAYGPTWDGSLQVPTKNAVYDKMQALAAGGGSLTDGDYGDVLVSGTGAVMTVQSAAGAFTTGGNISVFNGTNGLIQLGNNGSYYGTIGYDFGTGDLSLNQVGGSSKGITFRIGGTEIVCVNGLGVIVTGTLAVSGTITSGGSTVATVSQLANYLPLTGGTLSGPLRLGDGTVSVPLTVSATKELSIGGTYPDVVKRVTIGYSSEAGYGATGLMLENRYSGGAVCLQVITSDSSLYPTNAAGVSVPITTNTWGNPSGSAGTSTVTSNLAVTGRASAVGVNANKNDTIDTVTRNPGVSVLDSGGISVNGVELAGPGGSYQTRLYAHTGHNITIGGYPLSATTQAAFIEWARFTSTGLAVTGTVTATGTITSGGSTLATVSQLANYLPLTGGTLSGDLYINKVNPGLILDGGATSYYSGINIRSIFGWTTLSSYQGLMMQVDVGCEYKFAIGPSGSGVNYATLNTTGLAVTGKVSASNGVNANSTHLAAVSPRNPGVYTFDNGSVINGMEFGSDGSHYGTRLFVHNTNALMICGAPDGATMQAQFTTWAKFTTAGLAVTGNITATGTITSSGAPLATVSQLANYVAKSGDTMTGPLNMDGVGIIRNAAGWFTRDSTYHQWRNLDGTIQFGTLTTNGLTVNLGGNHYFGPDITLPDADTGLVIRATNYYASLNFECAFGGATMLGCGSILGSHGWFRWDNFYFKNKAGSVDYGAWDSAGLTINGALFAGPTGVADYGFRAAYASGTVYLDNQKPYTGFGWDINYRASRSHIFQVHSSGVPSAATDTDIIINATGINIPTGATYKINGVPIGGGGGLTDGDKGDVLVGGSGTTMTVQSAAGDFAATGQISAQGSAWLRGSNVTRIETGGAGAPAGSSNVGLELYQYGGGSYVSSYNRTTMASAPLFLDGSTVTFNVTPTVGGSALATVSQLANYLPLTGGTISGDTTINAGLTVASGATAISISPSSANLTLGGSSGTGQVIVGALSGTGNVILGRSTVSQTVRLAAGATTSGNTKTLEIGTGGLSGSTTAISIGSANGSTTTILGALTHTAGQLNTGTYINRWENSSANLQAGATGVGLEIYAGAGNSYVSSFNRTSAANAPLFLASSDTQLTINGVAIGAVDASGINLTTGKTFRVNGVAVGGGGLTDGDKGDVLVASSGASLTVQSAAGAFTAAGAISAPSVDVTGASSFVRLNPRTGSGDPSLLYSPSTQDFRINITNAGDMVQVTGAGTVLAGTLNTTGAITQQGNQVALVSQLANYLPLTGGNVSGAIQLSGTTAFPGNASSNAYIYRGPANGLVLYGAGTTYDLYLGNKNGSVVLVVPTGTTNAEFGGNIAVAGTLNAVGAITQNGTAVSLAGHTHAAGDITTGTFAAGRMPAYTGDVTSAAGATANTIATSVALAGSPTTTTQAEGDNSTKIATTAYVDRLKGLVNNAGGAVTLAIGHRGELYQATGNVTFPNAVFAAGDIITVYNNSAASITLIQGTSVTMRLSGTATTGTRTLALRGLAQVLYVSASECIVTGDVT